MDLSSSLPVLRTLLPPLPWSPPFTGTSFIPPTILSFFSPSLVYGYATMMGMWRLSKPPRTTNWRCFQKLPSSLLVVVLHSRCGWHASTGQRGGGHAVGPARAHGAGMILGSSRCAALMSALTSFLFIGMHCNTTRKI